MNVQQSVSPRDKRRIACLIEIGILVVVGIVAILIVANVSHCPDHGRQSSTKAMIAEVGCQIDLFKLDFNRYPATLDELARRPADIDPSKWLQCRKQKPVDGWGRDLFYRPPTTSGGRFKLGSLGRDGKEGGTGLDEDIWTGEGGSPPGNLGRK